MPHYMLKAPAGTGLHRHHDFVAPWRRAEPVLVLALAPLFYVFEQLLRYGVAPTAAMVLEVARWNSQLLDLTRSQTGAKSFRVDE